MMKQLQIYLPDENPAAISDSEDDMSLMDEIMAAWGDPNELQYLEHQLYRDSLDAAAHHEKARLHDIHVAIRKIGARLAQLAH
ncbi:MAG: hypothetical protein BroJett012_07220 [Betaproteobacteria bacterium]|jgi:hypothetical protein|nr:MAG: hypothetical protein BroJett012_07220 [Betaproteobacteria bacterium]